MKTSDFTAPDAVSAFAWYAERIRQLEDENAQLRASVKLAEEARAEALRKPGEPTCQDV